MGRQTSRERGKRERSAERAAPSVPSRPGLSPELEHELVSIVEANGCELVHATFTGGALRMFIDRPDREGGVDLSDCEIVSKQVSALLDVVDFGPGRYTLEVSSPGLDRQLYRPRDYERFTGSLAKVTFREPEGGKKRTVLGRIEEYRKTGPEGPEISLGPAERSERGESLTLPLDRIELARLEIEL